MKLKLKDQTVNVPHGSEAYKVLSAIMSNPNPPKTVGKLLEKLQQYEAERALTLKKLAGK